MAQYSFSPQFATIRSESPLSGMRPVRAIHTPLSFSEQRTLQIKSAQPELLSQGIASGLSEGVGGALKGITAAFVGEREKKEAIDAENRKHTRDMELAAKRLEKPEKTESELELEKLQKDNLRSLIDNRGGLKGTKRNVVPSGAFKGNIVPSGASNTVDDSILPDWEPEKKPDINDSSGIEELIPQDISPTGSRNEPPLSNIEPPKTPAQKRMFAGFAMTPEGKQLQKPLEQLATEQVPVLPDALIRHIIDQEYVPPEMSTLLASSTGLGVPDVGGKDVLSAQTQASAMTPATPGAVPTTPQDFADFAEEQRRKMIEEAIQASEAEKAQSAINLQQASGTDLLNNAYESWEDAEKANALLAQMYPDYQIKPIKQEIEDGQAYYVLQTPEKKGATQAGIPEGFKVKGAKMTDGKLTYDLEPMPEIKQQIKAIKQPLTKVDVMLNSIQDIKSIMGGLSPATGLTGTIMQWIPASDASDVRELLKSLQGNIAFQTLSEMRAASPTGGALGSVSNIELDLLSNSMGSINPNMSHFLFEKNLNQIEKILNDYKKGANEEIAYLENPQKFQSIQPQEDRVEIKSQEDYSKLKSGQKYIFNGVTGTKK
jgi:hypothetical protein